MTDLFIHKDNLRTLLVTLKDPNKIYKLVASDPSIGNSFELAIVDSLIRKLKSEIITGEGVSILVTEAEKSLISLILRDDLILNDNLILS